MSAGQSASIDLAPGNPYSLVLSSPVLLAPGCAVRELESKQLGALVTRTATLHTRRGPAPRFAPAPASLIVSEVPTVGIRTLLKEEARRWERTALPVIVSIQGASEETAEMAAMLENVEGIAGLLVTAEEPVATVVAATRRETQRPILAILQHSSSLATVAGEALAAGADTLVAAEAPRGAAGTEAILEGYWLGPAVFPLTLQALATLMAVTEAPLVALGGIATSAFAETALRAGATAVMIDAARWGDPHAPARIAGDLRNAPNPPAPFPEVEGGV